MYQSVLGAAITLPAAIVLPNTGDNHLLAVAATVSVLVGLAIIVTGTARAVAKKTHKA
jgi:LPXTG-motif cell wall-anchored protein